MGFGKDGKGVIMYHRDTITLTTLASLTALKEDSPPAISEDFRLIKAETWVSVEGLTSGQGPILIGIADGELSVGEIAECLQSQPTDANDNVLNEQAHRPVFPVAILHGNTLENGFGGSMSAFEKVVRWTFGNSESFTWWAYNLDGSALTTGGIVRLFSKYYGVWVR